MPQRVHAVMRRDHPLAGKEELRLRDVLLGQNIAPDMKYGVRHLLDLAARRLQRQFLPVLETESFELIRHYVLHEQAVGYQIPIGHRAPADESIVFRPMSERDVTSGSLILGQLRGRTLPVASARFAMQLAQALNWVPQ